MITGTEITESPWPNFTYSELACRCGSCTERSGENISAALMRRVQKLRRLCGFPLNVSSAYRCAAHPAEAHKPQPGTHHQGLAIDILVSGPRAHELLKHAMALDFTGIGISQSGEPGKRFIHLDIAENDNRPTLWGY